jgi:hypothetical protein
MPGPNRAKVGPAGQALAHFQIPLFQRVKEGRCTWYPMPKVGVATKLGRLATLAGRLA